MAITKGESSSASNGIKANTNGAGTIYELPWYYPPRLSSEAPPDILVPLRPFHDHICLTSYFTRVEKYRPVYLDDVVGNTETIERLKIIAKDGNMPHVIISGMPGIGKTTSILCLARQMLGDAYKEAVLELNASDERGESRGVYAGGGGEIIEGTAPDTAVGPES